MTLPRRSGGSGDAAGWCAALEEALAARRRVAERDPANLEWRRNLSIRLDSLGDLKPDTGDVAGAHRAYEEGLAIRRRLVDLDPRNMGGTAISLCLCTGSATPRCKQMTWQTRAAPTRKGWR